MGMAHEAAGERFFVDHSRQDDTLQEQQTATAVSQSEPHLVLFPLQSGCCTTVCSDFTVFVLKWQETRINGNSEILLNILFHHFPL